MGYSFAAGTTDGPGAFNFEQGINWLIARTCMCTCTFYAVNFRIFIFT